jgi:hypothetical protein
MEEIQMQSTDEWKEWKRFFSAKGNASTATRRDGIRTTRKAAMETARAGVFVVLSLASVGYFVFSGAYEVVSSPQAETSRAAVAAEPADAGGAPRRQKTSSGPATPADCFPAGYVNLGRDAYGNVITYEYE